MKRLYDRLEVAGEDRGLLSTMYFAFFVNGMMSVMLGSLLPYLKEAGGLDYTQSGLLLSAHQTGNLCALFFSGALPYVLGRKGTSLLLGSCMSAGLLLMALTGRPVWLLAAFALTGIGRGNWSNICNTTVGQAAGSKAAALNLLHAAFAVGALLSPLAVLAAVGLGRWQASPLFVCGLGVVAVALVALSPLEGKVARAAPGDGGAMEALRSRSFWIVTGILFFYLGAEASIVGWFVTYFTEAGILPPGAAAFTPTMLWFMIMLGRMVCAALAARANRNRLILLMGLCFCGFFLVMLAAGSGAVSVVCLLGLGFSMAGIYPTTFASLKNLSSTAANGLVFGIATAGAILMPALVGMVADRRGLGGGVTVILGSCVCMLVLIVVKLVSDRDGMGA